MERRHNVRLDLGFFNLSGSRCWLDLLGVSEVEKVR